MKSSEEEKKIQIYHRLNKLKLKAGFGLDEEAMGLIDKNAIIRAQSRIEQKEMEYPVTVKQLLDDLSESWDALKETDESKRHEIIESIYHYSNNIKDLTATYSHDLMHHFSLSLRDFCEEIDVKKPEHHVIVQAHLDVMWVTFTEKLRGEVGDKADELKKIVSQAIEKYF